MTGRFKNDRAMVTGLNVLCSLRRSLSAMIIIIYTGHGYSVHIYSGLAVILLGSRSYC